ncbi:PCI domain-containing protein [Lachancea thermotolerans]|uniref:KLTH0G00462p n=1 Tax=Lachancea thermotolerans (strain ATCC 56472 / CBS 6340 / NRRL Y-8284) TaxID=559295 RepID=C5DLG1_LACTC|nr:KLTH0G00462p [Lachancea thermotolerans CBS 6340]CAR24622.1 KLTH0G00462p [Lachancea thermotolerans CBS 6340]
MPTLLELVKSLNTAFVNGDNSSCQKLLSPVKIELIKSHLLVPDFSKAQENERYLEDLNVAKRVLEIGALCSLRNADFEAYENFFSQLRVFYFSGIPRLAESENKSKLISLYLLLLLSQGDVTKFHSELEFLGKRLGSLEEDAFLSYPIKVEKWLMEGSYQRAWDLLKSESKIEEFNVFTQTLMDAIREEIGRNTELAYHKLPLFNVKALLFFESEKDTEQFALARGWKVSGGCIVFDEEEVADDHHQTSIVEKALDYAINLESIV